MMRFSGRYRSPRRCFRYLDFIWQLFCSSLKSQKRVFGFYLFFLSLESNFIFEEKVVDFALRGDSNFFFTQALIAIIKHKYNKKKKKNKKQLWFRRNVFQNNNDYEELISISNINFKYQPDVDFSDLSCHGCISKDKRKLTPESWKKAKEKDLEIVVVFVRWGKFHCFTWREIQEKSIFWNLKMVRKGWRATQLFKATVQIPLV